MNMHSQDNAAELEYILTFSSTNKAPRVIPRTYLPSRVGDTKTPIERAGDGEGIEGRGRAASPRVEASLAACFEGGSKCR